MEPRLLQKALLGAAAFALSACSYHVDKSTTAPTTNFSQRALGFSDVQTTLSVKCATCHTHNHSWATSYEGVHSRLGEIQSRVQSTDPSEMMPPPGATPLSPDEKAALLAWIARGGPQVGTQPGQPTNPDNPPPPPAVPPSLSFAYMQQKVFSKKCATCHQHTDDFDTYAHATPELKEMQYRIHAIGTKDQMPPATSATGPLTPDELKLLDDWLKIGAPETGPLLPSLSFAYLQQQVFNKKCETCHNHSKDQDFASYENVKDLISEMPARLHNPNPDDVMPPPESTAGPLTPEELALADAWLKAGAPEVGPLIQAAPAPQPAPEPPPAPAPQPTPAPAPAPAPEPPPAPAPQPAPQPPAPAPQPAPAPAPAPEPPPAPAPQPTPAPAPAVTFALVKTQVFDQKCATCHHHQKHNDFANYDNVKPLLKEMQSRIHAFGTEDLMPPTDAKTGALSADELKLLDEWLHAGAPN